MEQSTKEENENKLWQLFNKYGFVLKCDSVKITGYIVGVKFTFLWEEAHDIKSICNLVDNSGVLPRIEIWHKGDSLSVSDWPPICKWLCWSEEVYADYVEKGLHI